ncbi:8-amino-7-oxononanoate synthase [Rhodomicrobium vannielii ATCC 17100]|uniref:8-amino-7-oxononanoate synthase n=1 Tax=Rhodomicrobium vannielii (strain ATCC 17100 / DSM 162 / LMG 4299 / NCIMB 10020 / ATH 3.1.1) TaxID=648757 RepID=E3HZE0_RHOVT|nr:alpha-hydroxyketone-type quorum-sensing autoinducer synthase [Rhodomicrobium vannielii]ADP69886.1 8-amino-7-oxononanoate synthase [Rhodomicrobium vannielii ATCC 17100]
MSDQFNLHHQTRLPSDPKFLFDRVECYYRERLDETWKGRHPMKGRSPGLSAIKLRSNDYLCVAADRRVIEAEVRALQASGHGDSVSRTFVHHEADGLNAFEHRVARLMGSEAAVLANSGYCANVGLIQAICRPDTPVFLDMKAHLSLWEGVKSAGAKPTPFRHNDAEHLDRLIGKVGPGVIVVDALYSIDGNIAALEDFVEVAERRGCALVVDETHSFGTHGPDGAGLVAALGLSHRVHFRTVGLSKAVASRGGLVICSQRNAEFLRYESLPVIFSTQVLAHEVAGYNAALDIFANEPSRQRLLHSNHRYLTNGLDELGYNVDLSRSQIIALEAGEILETIKLRDALEKRDVFGAIFLPPATPAKRCIIRFTVNCGLTRDELDRVLAVCAEIRDEVGLASWPSTRRRGRQARVASLPTALAA